MDYFTILLFRFCFFSFYYFVNSSTAWPRVYFLIYLFFFILDENNVSLQRNANVPKWLQPTQYAWLIISFFISFQIEKKVITKTKIYISLLNYGFLIRCSFAILCCHDRQRECTKFMFIIIFILCFCRFAYGTSLWCSNQTLLIIIFFVFFEILLWTIIYGQNSSFIIHIFGCSALDLWITLDIYDVTKLLIQHSHMHIYQFDRVLYPNRRSDEEKKKNNNKRNFFFLSSKYKYRTDIKFERKQTKTRRKRKKKKRNETEITLKKEILNLNSISMKKARTNEYAQTQTLAILLCN